MLSLLGLGIGCESTSKALVLKKADAQNAITRGSYRPKTVTCNNKFWVTMHSQSGNPALVNALANFVIML
jgi:hypothetical protein